MVSALLSDALSMPTKSLIELHDSHKTDSEFATIVSKHFAKIFETEDAFLQIPPLNVNCPPETYPDRSLVRFRAMVQDTSPSPEMYLSKLNGDMCGGWGIEDGVESGHNEEPSYERLNSGDLKERTILFAVTVPGESTWCSEGLDGPDADYVSASSHIPVSPHKYPLPDTPHIGVQVKIYDTTINPKPTELITFVGLLTSEPTAVDLHSSIPVNIPTLHVLFSVPYPHPRGLLPQTTNTVQNIDPSALRQELIEWIAHEALGGDIDCAEWVLLTCVATIQSRNPPVLLPTLTLSLFPTPLYTSAAPTPTLSHVLSSLLPITYTLPLSLSLINTHPFTPESKEEDLHSGLLQLPTGTTVLINERGVTEGKVVEQGLRNIRAMQDVITSQTLPYAFPYSEFSFPTELTFIVLSEGKKSTFFQTSITVPIQPDNSKDLFKSRSEIRFPSSEKVDAFRRLVGFARVCKVQIGDTVSEYIQTSFVQDRQADKSVTADDLIHRMTVARLLALSMHEKELTAEIWQRAIALDDRRKARFA